MSDDIEPANVVPGEPIEADQSSQAATEPDGPAGRRGLGDHLAQVRMSPGQLQTAMALCIVVSLGAFLVAWAGFSSRVDVARTEAQRAVVRVAEQQVRIEDQQRALAEAQDLFRKTICNLLEVFRARPGEPPPAPGRGELVAGRVEGAWRDQHCEGR